MSAVREVAAPPVRDSGRRAGIAAVLGANLFWSFGGVLGKAADAGGVVLSFWRMWIATGVMTIVVVVSRRRPTLGDFRRAAPLGVLFGLNIGAFFTTLEYLSIAVTLVIGALTPVVALPVAVLVLRERLTMVKVVCAVVAVGGVVVSILSAPSGPGDTPNTGVGYLWASISLLLWVGYLLVAKRVRTAVDTIPFMFVMSMVGAVTLTIVVVVVGEDPGRLRGAGWIWVAVLAIGPGLVGHSLLVWAQPRVDTSVSSLLIQLEPIGASLAAWAMLGERMTLGQGASMAVVVGALGVLAHREAREGDVALDEAVA